MKNYETLKKASDNRFYFSDGTELLPMFPQESWNSPEAFEFANVKGYEPMTAKEIETEEQQDIELSTEQNIIEEKFDGTRGIVQFFSQPDINGNEIGYCRIFSRRISKKTGFYVENSDSVPQIRDINVPSLAGTVLDGEMFINGQPFKEVSSTLNCLWDKAVERQLEKGFISLHAFDIIKYKGIDLRRMPLIRRKHYLRLAIKEARSKYIELVPYFSCGEYITNSNNETVSTVKEISLRVDEREIYNGSAYEFLLSKANLYPNLYNCLYSGRTLTPRAYYELIVSTGGEGVIVKPKSGRYHHKRGREYQKIKKFLTRECVIMGFTEPTKLYDGKFPNDRWSYWVDKNDNRMPINEFSYKSAKELKNTLKPVTRFYYYHMIGNIRYGVIITDEEIAKLPKNKKFNIEVMKLEGVSCKVLEVGDCAGFDDDTRLYFSFSYENIKTHEKVVITPEEEESNSSLLSSGDLRKFSFIGSVVEIKANELFKDTGKMRHPRFLRLRDDKSPTDCTWKDHVDIL